MQADPFADPNSQGPVDDGERVPCGTCGRKFNQNALQKHTKICQKVFVNKRKAFDIKEARKADGMQEIEREQ